MRQKSVEGIVVKITKDLIVLLCPDGTFKNIPRFTDDIPPMLGETYIAVQKNMTRPWLKWAYAAAIFMLAVVSYTLFPMQKDSYAYVLAIDINPSFELTMNSENKVLKTRSYNDEGTNLLSTLELVGKPLDEAFEEIVQYSIDEHYFSNEERFLETSVVRLADFEPKEVETMIKDVVVRHNVHYTISQNDPEFYDEAKELDVSVNKLSYLKSLEKAGVISSIVNGKDKSVSELRKIDKQEMRKQQPQKDDVKKQQPKKEPEQKDDVKKQAPQKAPEQKGDMKKQAPQKAPEQKDDMKKQAPQKAPVQKDDVKKQAPQKTSEQKENAKKQETKPASGKQQKEPLNKEEQKSNNSHNEDKKAKE